MQRAVLTLFVLLALTLGSGAQSQDRPITFGGAYETLDARRQQLVRDWLARFEKVTGQSLEPAAFYDDILRLSTKTTFEAVTHALLTTPLTDASGASLGDGLSIIDQMDAVRGDVPGTPGDHQFRIYVLLKEDAVDRLQRSQQFKRGVDNSIYHKGYPMNYRAQGGTPSIQVSIALDKRHADVDVDYRSSSFPVALFNGHLTSSNSDVRAGNNFDRHVNRWSGFQNWWRSFFGVRQQSLPDDDPAASPLSIPGVPRAGKGDVEKMAEDFLKAWLVDKDIVAAMSYLSERSYACIARDAGDPSFDRGVAPYRLMMQMKAASDALGPHSTLEGLVVGTRLTIPGLRVVRQAHHPQFVEYAVADDIAADFECENQMELGDPKKAERTYGTYGGTTFYIAGAESTPVALLWARESGYWKIVSWKTGTDDASTPAPEAVTVPAPVHVPADPQFAGAVRAFLDTWLVRRDYDAAFRYVSPAAYACYNLERGEDVPAATSADEAGRRIEEGLESLASQLPKARRLSDVIAAAEPIHPSVRILDHRDSAQFALTSAPNALNDAAGCEARANGLVVPDPLPLEYGEAFGTAFRFKTPGGDAPVLRLMWRKDGDYWRVTSYAIELP